MSSIRGPSPFQWEPFLCQSSVVPTGIFSFAEIREVVVRVSEMLVCWLPGVFSMVGDKLNERLRKVFESKAVAGQPKIYDSVRDTFLSFFFFIFSIAVLIGR